MKKEIAAIRKEFRRSEEARYIHRLHGVLLVLLGLSTVKAGKLLGDPQRTVAHWVGQWKARGLIGLRDGEKSGRPGALNPSQMNALTSALAKPPADFALKGEVWTGLLVASLLKKRFGIALSSRQCHRILQSVRKQTKAEPNARP